MPVSGVGKVCKGLFHKAKSAYQETAKNRRLSWRQFIVMHNFPTELVVSNQIKTVFDLEYKGHVNLKEYD
jgi:hypothetical protein